MKHMLTSQYLPKILMRGGKVRKKGKKMSKGLVTGTQKDNKSKNYQYYIIKKESQNKISVSGTRS